MKKRDYSKKAEEITPTFFKENQKIGWAMIQAIALYLQEKHNEILRLIDFWDINQDFARNLDAIGDLFGLDRKRERAETFRAKILTRIALDGSSGTFKDLELLFNNLSGEGNWQASNPETAYIKVNINSSITKIVDNLITSQNQNLVTQKEIRNLVVWRSDPTFLQFLSNALASGIKLEIEEN